MCLCVCVCSSNISADQDQTDLRVSTWLLRGSRVCDVGFVWTTTIPLINESGPSLFQSVAILRRTDNKVESESVDVYV